MARTIPIAGYGEPLLSRRRRVVPLLEVVKKLGLIGFYSFGGTQANLAMFYRYLVEDLEWISDAKYAEYLPGDREITSIPGATAVQLLVTCTAYASNSVLGGVLAAFFFSMPAAVAMLGFGLFMNATSAVPGSDGGVVPAGYHKTDVSALMQVAQITVGCAAVGVVAMGAIKLAQKLVKTKAEKIFWTIAVLGCVGTMMFPKEGGVLTVAVLVIGGVANWFLKKETP